MACRLFSVKPLPETTLISWELNCQTQIPAIFDSKWYDFHSKECIGKMSSAFFLCQNMLTLYTQLPKGAKTIKTISIEKEISLSIRYYALNSPHNWRQWGGPDVLTFMHIKTFNKVPEHYQNICDNAQHTLCSIERSHCLLLCFVYVIVRLFPVVARRWFTNIKSSPPSDAYMCQWTGSTLVQIMACRLFGAKPLHEQTLTYCQLDP